MIHMDKPKEMPPSLQAVAGTTPAPEKVRNWRPNKDVRAALLAVYDNCAYCERDFDQHTMVINHYRPRGLFPDCLYDWSNLLPVCMKCNTYKGSQFPTLTVNGEERPLIVNPERDDPEPLFRYDLDGVIASTEVDPRAAATIDWLRLNHQDLVAERKQRLDGLIQALQGQSSADAVFEAQLQDGPFIGMIRFFQRNPSLIQAHLAKA